LNAGDRFAGHFEQAGTKIAGDAVIGHCAIQPLV
jgi:hypothetical protein